MDPALTTLHRLLEEHADEIIDDGTAWVRAESHADLSSRPYAETRGLVAQCLHFYRAHIFAGDTGPREAFIEVVTSNRSNLKFSVSTLLRGFLSFREAMTRLLARLELPAEQALAIVRRIDVVSFEASFRTADIYVAKLNRVLDATREELIRKDKLAALGGLVAGVAHEINTPLGVAVTAASLVADRLHEVEAAFTAGTLRRQDLQQGLIHAQEAARMTLGNLRRAAGMVGNFKQIAVDQTSEARREVALGPYVREVVASLGPMYRRTPHRVLVQVLQDVELTTFVGAISQVCTNLVHNALMHAFPGERPGQITLTVDRQGDGGALLICRDDGAGMDAQVLRRIYEPFFTTQRGRGGSGLGMHIVHNLVTDLLGGSIAVESSPGQGTAVTIQLPNLSAEVDLAAQAPERP
ncbi:HAMP domain-containing sensor histidine kinase [Nannocystis sp.]|uniref:sensor histidine kinase n=1 Tax=Nannocystis sp. TaxID=1962667 RepID=UPI002429213D|nr:HAMP domain-containing sensor histidine kinase [Nannocystis sp.]MBK7824613.1 HAMP domain-containing histidine kinase [Nannocystis sp.]MBK9753135.1 HAMP domain-containing histidine kinase [Nannocystis sp.]